MALTANVIFDTTRDALSGDGWTLASWDDSLDTPTITTNNYATITALKTALTTLFQGDATIDAYYEGKAEAQVIAAHLAEVATDKTALKTADGL